MDWRGRDYLLRLRLRLRNRWHGAMCLTALGNILGDLGSRRLWLEVRRDLGLLAWGDLRKEVSMSVGWGGRGLTARLIECG